jgi:hypothetical protein
MSSAAFAQTPSNTRPASSAPVPNAEPEGLATPTGHELSVSVGGYNYEEPGDLSISIHGPKFGGGYIGTLPLNRKQHWFAQADVHGTIGSVTYDGWCSPYLITPESTSPNGYLLDVGDASSCSEKGDKDWYVEARGLVGKDFVGHRWAFTPDAGIGFRDLANGTTGVASYRTDKYLYLPIGLTARTRVGDKRSLGFTIEYDHLLHGWQNTHDSQLGGGDIPATSTAPAFTIDGFSDISFDQHQGWALRVSAKYQITPRWSLEPAYIHWNVSASPVNYETATFTVNGITAQEQFGAYEPVNVTHEFVLRLGFHL